MGLASKNEGIAIPDKEAPCKDSGATDAQQQKYSIAGLMPPSPSLSAGGVTSAIQLRNTFCKRCNSPSQQTQKGAPLK
jgi:hypothetical protein